MSRKQPFKTKVIAKANKDGTRTLSVYDPLTNREIPTGCTVKAGDAPEQIRRVKEQLERAGHRVDVKEL